MCLQCVSVVRLIVATRSSCPPASDKIIKEMPVSVVSGTPYIIIKKDKEELQVLICCYNSLGQGKIFSEIF